MNLNLFQVYTVSVSELITYIPKTTLPLKLGGTQEPCHTNWLQLCYACATKQAPDPSNYFFSHTSCQRASVSCSPSTEFDNILSDLDSESSKDTVNEKHTNEDREKEKEEDINNSEMDDQSQKQHCSTDKSNKVASNRKRKTSDCKTENSSVVKESNRDLQSDEPCKKRPPSSGSNILDDSIHMPSTNGITIEELLENINSMKRKGLMGEYGSIKMEAPSGTFNNSK